VRGRVRRIVLRAPPGEDVRWRGAPRTPRPLRAAPSSAIRAWALSDNKLLH